jgi:tRNA(Arg) A34 adenosine deaminase TadA
MHKYLLEAAKQAMKGHPARRAFVGAVGIRKDGKIVRSANGRADVIKHGIHANQGMVMATRNHAEKRLALKLTKGSIVYVGRVYRDTGKLALAKPCAFCYNALRNSGVAKCYYTISEHEYGVIEF